MIIRALISISGATRQRRLSNLLRELDVVTAAPRKGEDFWERLSSQPFDLVFLGERERSVPDGKMVASIRALPGMPSVIVFAKDADQALRADLLAAGCEAILSPEVPADTLRKALAALADRRRQIEHLRLQTTELTEYRLGDFVSASPAMRQLLNLATRVANADTTVLVLGETGVGKEWLARAIHSEGKRSAQPFVAVNCGAIPEGLVESHLFGHRAGAFTGATTDHRGVFEVAHGGTIFLDEIAEMPAHLQVRLLRVLEERSFQRVGSERTISVDIRVIAATNREPKLEIESGRLREDLYYRLGVVALRVPPLRDRRGDIQSIAVNHFEIFCTKLGRRLSHIEPVAMDALLAYQWPGNVRELINVMERAVLLANATSVTLADLPEEIRRGASGRGSAVLADGYAFPGGSSSQALLDKSFSEARRELLDAFEKRYITEILSAKRGRVGEAAKQAGITPRALFDKIKRHGLRKEDFR